MDGTSPPISNATARKLRGASAFLLLAVAAIASFEFAARSSESAQAAPVDETGVASCELDGYRFEYHAPSGTEALYRIDDGSARNQVFERADVAERCRALLTRRLGVERLDALREPYRQSIRRLHALGYL